MVQIISRYILLIALIWPQLVSSHLLFGNGHHPKRRCGKQLQKYVGWVCDKPNLKFPFAIPRYFKSAHHSKSLRAMLPPQALYPYPHAALYCCKYGCQNINYLQICDHHDEFERCKKSIRASGGRDYLGRCLRRTISVDIQNV